MGIKVLDPTLDAETEAVGLAARLSSLEGRTVGLLDNHKHNVDRFLDHVESLLRSRHGVKLVVRVLKPDQSRPAPPEALAELSRCDAAVSAVGD